VAAPAAGQGEGTVQFTVAPNADPVARTSAVVIEDQRLQISQEARRCEFQLSSTSESIDPAGGERTIRVTTASPQCRWTSAPAVPWITVASGGDGSGNGAVTFRVDPLSGPERAGTIQVAGVTVRVEQGVGCNYALAASTFSVGPAGGTVDVPVSAAAACTWSAVTTTPWISIVSGETGRGPGVATIRVAAADGLTRTGALTVAGRVVTIQQSAACTYQLDPATYAAPQAGGATSATVRTSAGCTWTASSTAPWITMTAGQSGTGPGEVRFAVAANAGQSRTGSVRVGDQTLTVTQGSGCTASVSPGTISVGAQASIGAVQVASGDGCGWTATSGAPWIAITGGASGTGNGQVTLSIAANTGPARDASVAVAGHTVAVLQANGCTYSVTPPAQEFAGGGGSGGVAVTTAPGCTWTASTNAEWLVPMTTRGTGPGQASFTVASNAGPARSGSLMVAGQALAISQASLCTWGIAPPSTVLPASGGNGNVLVIVGGACTWTAASDVDWITLTSGASGTGNGLVQFVAGPSNGAPRTGSLTIAGQRYEVVELAR
jgi:hypothetical protein